MEGSGGPPPPPPEPDAEELPPSGPPRCPRCGAEHELDQEYCLECGLRLQPLGAPGRTVVRRELWSRDSPAWLWATLLALLLVALVAGAIAAVAATQDDDEGTAGRPVVTTNQGTTETVGTVTDTSPLTVETILPTGTTLTVPSITTGTTSTTTTSTTTTTTQNGSIRSWPAGKDGYTIVLASIETSRGRAPAERQANDAIDAGLPEVGILNSSDYLTLNPGYYVVFTGIYDSLSQARSALPTARAHEPVAYVREITP